MIFNNFIIKKFIKVFIQHTFMKKMSLEIHADENLITLWYKPLLLMLLARWKDIAMENEVRITRKTRLSY